jgi:acyl-CoA synthetase (NDP forming)
MTPAECPVPPRHTLAGFFTPQSVAIVGATERPGYGQRLMTNMLNGGFPGEVYPVNPHRSSVLGRPAFPALHALPGAVDLAIVAVPADQVSGVIEACGRAGIGRAIVVSNGFAEAGGEGSRRQDELVAVAARSGVRMLGPNCLGIVDYAARLYASASGMDWAAPRPLPGRISVITQSGALGSVPIPAAAAEHGIGLRRVISVGNQADLGIVDFMAYLADDEATDVISVYMESLRPGDGARFIEAGRRAATAGKPVLVLKSGRTAAGAAAAQSHTGILAGSDRVYDGCFRQAGLIRVDELRDLWESAAALRPLARHRPSGGCAFVSNSGGMNSLLVDACVSAGSAPARLTDRTSRVVGAALRTGHPVGNPVDVSGAISSAALGDVLAALDADPGTDSVVVGITPLASGPRSVLIADRLIEAGERAAKPRLVVWPSAQHAYGTADETNSGAYRLAVRDVPVVTEPRQAAAVLSWWRQWSKRRHDLTGPPRIATGTPPTAAAPGQDALALARWAGIRMPESRLTELDERAVQAAAADLGFPVVLKVQSPGLAHKTDLGAVAADVRTSAEVSNRLADLASRTIGLGAQRRVLLQRHIHGYLELAAGFVHHAIFGPVVMVAVGGTRIEQTAATSWRSVPIGPADVLSMLDEIGMRAALCHARGVGPLDTAEVVEAVLAVGRIAESCGRWLDEFEINPLIVCRAGEGAFAVDALTIVRPPAEGGEHREGGMPQHQSV